MRIEVLDSEHSASVSANTPVPNHAPTLYRDERADVVVGSGIAGMSVAMRFPRPERRQASPERGPADPPAHR